MSHQGTCSLPKSHAEVEDCRDQGLTFRYVTLIKSTSVVLIFYICKKEIIISPSMGYWEDQMKMCVKVLCKIKLQNYQNCYYYISVRWYISNHFFFNVYCSHSMWCLPRHIKRGEVTSLWINKPKISTFIIAFTSHDFLNFGILYVLISYCINKNLERACNLICLCIINLHVSMAYLYIKFIHVLKYCEH